MNILHVITGLGTGGAERMLERIVNSSTVKEIKHEVVCLGQSGTIANSLLTNGVRVYILNGKGRLSAPRVLFSANKIVRQTKPDIIQGWMYDGNLAASWLGWRNGISCLWNVRHSIANINREKLDLRLAIYLSSLISSSAKTIIFNSTIAANQHKKLGFNANRQSVIPNGFDINRLRPCKNERAKVRNELGLANEDFLIGMIARFHPMKDHTMFIRVALSLCENHKRVFFLLVGNGVDADNRTLVEMIRKSDFADRFFILGEREDIASIYNALDLAVSSSAWGEGFSNVLGEAMATGIPCVSTNVGDAEFIIGDTGIVVPPENENELSKAIELLLVDKTKLRVMGESARLRIIEKFSIENITNKYIQLWNKWTDLPNKIIETNSSKSTLVNETILPTFYMPGAPKCGTTALSSWLSMHPEICMSKIKEPQFFNTDMGNRIIETMDRYSRMFEPCTTKVKHRGEASVWYLYSRDAVSNILSITPNARFIVMIRNPIDMAVSLHRQKVFNGEELVKSFEKAWDLQKQRAIGKNVPWSVAEPLTLQYGKVCKLGEQVKRLLKQVKRENILFINHDELATNPRKTYLQLLEFLEIQDDGRDDFPYVNEAKQPKLMMVQKCLRVGDKLRRKLGVPRYGYELTSTIRRMNTDKPPPAKIDITLRKKLAQYFSEDIRLLSDLTGYDLSHWS